MGLSQRRKGAAAERELCDLLSDELGFKVSRNLDQVRAGGADILCVPQFAIEIKRREALSRPAWWAQAVRQALREGVEPMVFYRRSREPWRALIQKQAGADPIYVSFDTALLHIREAWAYAYCANQ